MKTLLKHFNKYINTRKYKTHYIPVASTGFSNFACPFALICANVPIKQSTDRWPREDSNPVLIYRADVA